MAGISNIPTGRVSEVLVRQRLLTQVQGEQLALYRLQQQLSTGQRFFLPSENPVEALRGIAIQDLIQRKTQIKTNLSITQTLFDASENALSNVATQLNEARSLLLSNIGGTSSPSSRAAAVQSIDLMIDQLVRQANQSFQGRYLFSGARSGQPAFQRVGNTVQYLGDTNNLQTFYDLGALFDSNLTGDVAFGALSQAVNSTNDLNPVLLETTPLSQLRAGRGITRGSIAVSDGTFTSIVDLSGAVTIGDVARRIQQFPPGWDQTPPTGRTIRVRVTDQGLEMTLNGGALSVSEVGGGTTAAELGIKTPGGFGAGPFRGGDLNPLLTRTTQLADMLGARARSYLTFAQGNNDLLIESTSNGSAANGTVIKVVNDAHFQAGVTLSPSGASAQFTPTATAPRAVLRVPGLGNDLLLTATTAGIEFNDVQIHLVDGGAIGDAASAVYDAGPPKSLTITVDGSGQTTVDTMIGAINGTGLFTAARDVSAGDDLIDGSSLIPVGALGLNVGNTFQTGSVANTLVIRVQPGFTTAQAVIDAVNATGNFRARIDVSEWNNNGSGTVYDVTLDSGAAAVLAQGRGENLDQTSGLLLTNGGQTRTIDISQARTIDDLLNLVNGSGAGVVASINGLGNGLDLRSNLSGSVFAVGENGGSTATQLGVRSYNELTALKDLNFGAGVRKTDGVDFEITRSDGVVVPIRMRGGTYATARLNPTLDNAGLVISSLTPGTSGNSYSVRIIDSGSGGGDSVSLSGNTLTFEVDLAAGFTANDAIALLNGDLTLGTQFHARLDTSTNPANDGSGDLIATTSLAFTGGKTEAVNIGDVLNLINFAPENLAATGSLVARLATVGNGIEMVDNAGGVGSLVVNAGLAAGPAIDLGLIPEGETTSAPASTAAGVQTLTGSDRHFIQVEGVFTALFRIREAILANDSSLAERATTSLDEGIARVSAARAELGLRSRGIDDLLLQFEDQMIALEAARSQVLEVDFAEIVSELAARQISYEAALRAAGSISQMSLLNFL